MNTKVPHDKTEFVKGILRSNPAVSREVVAQSERLEEELRKLGVDLRPRYSLSPPLGDGVRQIHNRTRKSLDH